MRTNNYYAALKALMYGYGLTNITAIDYTGASKVLYNYCYHKGFREGNLATAIFPTSLSTGSPNGIMYAINKDISSGDVSGVRFGTGTTEPTVDDYKLSGTLITGISILESSTKEVTFTDSGAVVVTTYDVKNTSGAELTIGEIGFFADMRHSSSNSVSAFLIDRTLLDEPVTIPADGFAAIKYTLTYTF